MARDVATAPRCEPGSAWPPAGLLVTVGPEKRAGDIRTFPEVLRAGGEDPVRGSRLTHLRVGCPGDTGALPGKGDTSWDQEGTAGALTTPAPDTPTGGQVRLAAGGPCLPPASLLSDTAAASGQSRGGGSAPSSSHMNHPPRQQLTAHGPRPPPPAWPHLSAPASPLGRPSQLDQLLPGKAVFQVNAP